MQGPGPDFKLVECSEIYNSDEGYRQWVGVLKGAAQKDPSQPWAKSMLLTDSQPTPQPGPFEPKDHQQQNISSFMQAKSTPPGEGGIHWVLNW